MRAVERDRVSVLRPQTRTESYAEGWSLLPHSSVPEPISAIRRVRNKRFANRRPRSKSHTEGSHRRRAARASLLGQCPLRRLATHAYFFGGSRCRVSVLRLRQARANQWQLRRSIRVTSTGADFKACAADRPPKPPPMIMTFDRSLITLLHSISSG